MTGDLDLKAVGGRRPVYDNVDSGGIQCHSLPGFQLAKIEMFGSEQPLLFADSDNDFQWDMVDLLLFQDLDCFDNFGDAGLVIGAENGLAGAGVDAISQDRLDIVGRSDGVHMH